MAILHLSQHGVLYYGRPLESCPGPEEQSRLHTSPQRRVKSLSLLWPHSSYPHKIHLSPFSGLLVSTTVAFSVKAKYGRGSMRGILRSCCLERQITCLSMYIRYAGVRQVSPAEEGGLPASLCSHHCIHLAGAQLHQDNLLIFQSEGGGRQWPLSVLLCVPLDPSYKLFKTIGNFVCSIPPYFTRKKTHSPVTLSFLPGTFRISVRYDHPKV